MTSKTRTPAAGAAAAATANTAPQAINAPQVIIGKGINGFDSNDVDLGGMDKSIEMSADMTIEELRDHLNAGNGHVDSADFKDFAQTIEYMEERVLVRVSPSSEPNAERIIEVWNNGTPQRFIRDAWVVAKRKYVEVLARSMPFSVTTPEALDARGDKTRRIDVHTGQRHPFEMHDPNNPAKGRAWLNALFMER